MCGSFLLSLEKGSISILGAKLTESSLQRSYPVYAPLSHPLPVITGLKSKKSKSQNSVILLKNHDSGLGLLPNICPFCDPIFKAPSSTVTYSPQNPTFHILFDSETPIPQTTYPLSWREAFLTISSASTPKVLICGAKGAGKSTMCQYLTNSLLRRGSVNYLETDPGQPSFTPPGLVALSHITGPILSPSFTRTGSKEVVRCHHFGNISPRDSPRYYVDCIRNLLSQDITDSPLIINTPGWTKGTGLELLTSLIEIAMPDFVIILSVPGNDTLARALHPVAQETKSHMLIVEPVEPIRPIVQLTAADLRTLSLMTYFHLIGEDKWDFDTHLTAWKPWILKYSGPPDERGVFAVAIQGEELLLEDIILAINGTIVAINLVHAIDGDLQLTPEGLPVLCRRETPSIDPRDGRCVGYAVIRGIDSAKGELMLLSPWGPSDIQEGERILLERGRVNLPVWGMWNKKEPRVLGPWLQRS